MALQSDSQGFLTGSPVDLSKAVDQLRRIKTDISDIKRAMLGAAANAGGDNRNNSGSSSAGSNPRVSRESNSSAATPNRPRSSQNSPGNILLPISYGDVVTPNNGRASGASGGFTGNGDAGPGAASNKNEKGGTQSQQNIISDFAGHITTAVKASASSAEDADPTIKAFKEVAEPMRRGYEIFTGGGGDKKERWYKKIWKELSNFRKDESVFNRAANRSLHNIEGNPGSGGGESPGFLGGLIGSISPWVMAAITGIGSALLAGVTTALGVIFSPIGLAIGAAAAVAWGLFTDEGQKFFGEVGAKVIAGWDAAVTAFAPVSESIQKGWDTVKGGFDSLINGMVSSWDAFTGFLKDKFGIDIPAIFKPVVDVSKKVVEAAKETVKDGVDVAKETAGKAVDAVAKSSPKTTEALGNAWDKVKDGAGKIASHATGKTAANKAAMINEMAAQGITDPNEQAMLMAEVDHESGGFTKTKENLNYRSGRLMEISKTARDKGRPAVDAAVAQGEDSVAELMYGGRMGNTEKGDGAKYIGRGLIQLTGKDNYAAASKDLGIDLVNHPELAESPEVAAKTAVWFWKKNKLGESAKNGDVRANRRIINNGENGLAEVEKKRDKYLAEANNGEFNVVATEPKPATEQKPAVASVANDPTKGGRYKYKPLEGGNAIPSLHNLAAGPGGANQTQTAYAAAPKIPSFTQAPAPAEAPPIKQYLASNSDRNTPASAPIIDVGQDIKDRNIAHIVTGGFSGRG